MIRTVTGGEIAVPAGAAVGCCPNWGDRERLAGGTTGPCRRDREGVPGPDLVDREVGESDHTGRGVPGLGPAELGVLERTPIAADRDGHRGGEAGREVAVAIEGGDLDGRGDRGVRRRVGRLDRDAETGRGSWGDREGRAGDGDEVRRRGGDRVAGASPVETEPREGGDTVDRRNGPVAGERGSGRPRAEGQGDGPAERGLDLTLLVDRCDRDRRGDGGPGDAGGRRLGELQAGGGEDEVQGHRDPGGRHVRIVRNEEERVAMSARGEIGGIECQVHGVRRSAGRLGDRKPGLLPGALQGPADRLVPGAPEYHRHLLWGGAPRSGRRLDVGGGRDENPGRRGVDEIVDVTSRCDGEQREGDRKCAGPHRHSAFRSARCLDERHEMFPLGAGLAPRGERSYVAELLRSSDDYGGGATPPPGVHGAGRARNAPITPPIPPAPRPPPMKKQGR
jgi:hypothetical protein